MIDDVVKVSENCFPVSGTSNYRTCFKQFCHFYQQIKMLYAYVNKRLSAACLNMINSANAIISEYQLQGYLITLRQLFYQFVSRNLLENSKSAYQKVCKFTRDGRMTGLIDWDAFVDNTRHLETRARWNSPRSILDACASQYHVDLWKGQASRVEVWIEKDALVNVIKDTCNRWDCPYLACRGYTSLSEIREAALRIMHAKEQGYRYTILYAGDHDPSGSDMSRDIQDRLSEFGASFNFQRIALNMDQVKQFALPPNRIKESDSRSQNYERNYGTTDCWELDALPPNELNRVIETGIKQHISDDELFNARINKAKRGRKTLREIAVQFKTVAKMVQDVKPSITAANPLLENSNSGQ